MTDEEKKRQEEQGQGGSKEIYARYGNRMQAMTEQGFEALGRRKHREMHSPQRESHNARNNQAIEKSCHCPHRGQITGLKKEEGTE